MGLISPYTLIRAMALFHLTAAFLFLTSPKTITDQNVVFILGESMGLPQVETMDKPSEASAFLAVILAFLGLADLTGASLEEVTALSYWLSNVPVRLTFLFGITAYSYLFKEGGLLGPVTRQKASIGEPLQNSLVFTWGFMELVMWYWIFTSLRDERRAVAQRIIEKRRADSSENRL